MAILNLTLELERLIETIAREVPEFGHVDPHRVMVCVTSTRGGGVHGMYAKIHPLRFENGSRTTVLRRKRGSVTCEIPPVTRAGVEVLYLIYFLVPRFFDLPFRDKMTTIFHELYHISPEFNGDIRRFAGRNYAHGSSRKAYNALMATLVDRFLDQRENRAQLSFLEDNLSVLRSRHESLMARKMKVPKLQIVKSRDR